MKAVLLREIDNLFSGFVLLEKTVLRRLYTHDDVVQDAETFNKLEVLVDHPDPERVGIIGVFNLDYPAIFLDDTFFRLIQTEEDTHECGLTCSVFAQKCMNLTFSQLEGDVVVGNNTREPLGDVQHFNCILFFQCMPPLAVLIKT